MIAAPTRPDLDEVVGEVALGDAATFVRAAASASRRSTSWAAVPAPVRGRAIAHIGRLVEDNAEALARLVTAGDRQAVRRGARRGPGDRRHLRLLPRRGAAAVRADRARARCPTSSCSPSASRSATVAVITAGNFPVAVPSWYLVPALLAGNTVVWKPAEYAAVARPRFHELFVRGGGLPDGVLNIVHADGAGDLRRAGRRPWTPGSIDKVGFTGSSAVGPRDRRADRAAPADRLPGARRQEPAGRHPERRPRPGRRGRAVLRLRHRRAALHLARHGDRARVGARRVPAPLQRGGGGRRGRRPDPGRADGPDARREVRRPVRGVPRLDRSRTTASQAASPAGSRADNPRHGLRRRPRGAGCSTTRWSSTASAAATRCSTRRRSGRSSASTTYTDARRGDRAGQRPRLRPVVVDLHHRPGGGVRLPGRDRRRHGQRSTTRPPAPRRTCRSAATASPATARASPASGCSTSSPAGRR